MISVDAHHLKTFVERIERIETEIGQLNDDKKDIYAEAKGNGYDPKILKRVVAYRRRDRDQQRESDEIFDLYLTAVESGMQVATRAGAQVRAHEATFSGAEATP